MRHGLHQNIIEDMFSVTWVGAAVGRLVGATVGILVGATVGGSVDPSANTIYI